MAKLISWLYLPDAYTPIISRLIGLLSLPIGVVIWFWTHAGYMTVAGQTGPGGQYYPQPFNVPAWRIDHMILDLPLPAEPVNIVVFALYAAASLWLIVGGRRRFLYIYMAAVLAYYASREWFVCCFFWVLLDFLFLVALSTRAGAGNKNNDKNSDNSDNLHRSPCRRLIQVALTTCYLYSVLQKAFYPDFWQGISLEAFFYDGFAVTPPFKSLFIEHQLPLAFWTSASIFLTAGELFIAVGLFFKKTRIAACALGLILHGGIIVLMDPIIAIFSLEMWTGYLAYFEKKPIEVPTHSGGPPAPVASPLKTAFSLAFIALMVLMPARIYFLPGPSNELLTLFDRTPWTFGMFLMRQKVDNIQISIDDADGKSHNMEATGRIKTISNDNELIALARYVRANNPLAASIRINDQIIVNERRRILKTLIWDKPAEPDSWPRITVTGAGDYCRGAANKNPDYDRHP